MKIHCIGIGGIGVSALAQYYVSQGHEVSGSDLASSEITEFLGKKGIKIFAGNNAEHIPADCAMVVHSPAVQKDNLSIGARKN
jgi:UDP-N-acetylmuramate--alanine ligase